MKSLKICLVILCLLPVRAVGTPQFSGANLFMEMLLKHKKLGAHYVYFDDDDYEKIKKHKWYLHKTRNNKNIYCKSTYKKGVTPSIKMHTLLMGHQPGMVIDHIDGNGLNNRKSNLRICTGKENTRNQGLRITNTSGFKGVSYYKTSKTYMSAIMVDGKNKNQGYFKTAKEAAIAYNKAAVKYFGEFARLNEV